MSLPSSYLITTKNFEQFLNAIKSAKAPERVNSTFLKNLEFTSSNDRLFIGVMKSLGLIDENGIPTKRYFDFLDQSRSASILADSLRDAYSDLFSINTKAYELSAEELKNKFRTLTQGQYSDNVLGLMAKTFKTISDLADWNSPSRGQVEREVPFEQPQDEPSQAPVAASQTRVKPLPIRELHYNIQVVLPETRDPAVFDAIFDSLRKHLLG